MRGDETSGAARSSLPDNRSGPRRPARLVGVTVGVVVGLLVAAGLLRIAIHFDLAHLRTPDLYADDLTDDDYWKLHYRWVPQYHHVPAAGFSHPLLGWAPPETPDNPLGAITAAPSVPDFGAPALLFYGDSFVRGETPMPARIPQQLGGYFPGVAVYNLGVGGYGIDQTFLRFEQSYRRFVRPIVLFGILTEDLDRAVLSVRSGQKPRFVVAGDRLVLPSEPIAADQPTWLAAHPPEVWSYFLAMIVRRVRLIAGGRRLGVQSKRAEKEAIATRILANVVSECRESGTPLVFVLFYGLAGNTIVATAIADYMWQHVPEAARALGRDSRR